MKKLSIIIPFCGEFPQVLFTIQAVAQDLIDRVDFEIIAVNNHCEQVKQQTKNLARKAKESLFQKIKNNNTITEEDLFEMHKMMLPTYEDKSGASIDACSKGNSWLKYIEYKDRLSHWQAKRIGVENSTGRILMFIDAHCIPSRNSIYGMYKEYTNLYDSIGTIHLPLTYKILEWRKLIYKIFVENDYFYSYKFTPFRFQNLPFEVPCMSTCGMMISRDIYDYIGGWPKGLGIYGGGENFLNYTLAVCGFKKYIYPLGTLFHHGEKRDYHYEYDDFVKNRLIAHYLFGGEDLLWKLVSVTKGGVDRISQLAREAKEEHKDHRTYIKLIQNQTIQEWLKGWENGI